MSFEAFRALLLDGYSCIMKFVGDLCAKHFLLLVQYHRYREIHTEHCTTEATEMMVGAQYVVSYLATNL